MSAADINFFFSMREQIKIYHWQTNEFARHKATDEVIEALDESIDKYVEVYMGKYGRPKLAGTDAIIRLTNLTEAGVTKLVRAAINYMNGPLVKHLNKETDTDLINLRDEMMGSLHQLLYLFTLH